MSIKNLLKGSLALLVLAAPSTATAASPYERGPDPTVASLTNGVGPFTYYKAGVKDSQTPGFGTANVWYPTTNAFKFGAIAIAPGFFGDESTVSWLGPRLASRGFVVITFNTASLADFPVQRGAQLRYALKYLVTSSVAKNKIDPTRLAVMGHSMGGGGALEAAKGDPSLKAVVGLAPWNTQTNWSQNTVPTMLLGYRPDIVAPVADHASPFYNSMPTTLPKAYLEFRTGDHQAPTKSNPISGTAVVAWMKRFVDEDTRYTKFLCPTAAVGMESFTSYRTTCGTF